MSDIETAKRKARIKIIQARKQDCSIINPLFITKDSFAKRKLQEECSKYFGNIFTSFDSDEAIEIYNTDDNEIHVIIIDIDISGGMFANGLQLAEYLRTVSSKIPIIFFSSKENSHLYSDGYRVKLDAGHFIEPVDPSLLMIAILTKGEAYYEHIQLEKAIKEVKRQKKEIDQILEAVDNKAIISETDTKGMIVKVNDLFCQISGYTEEELIGQPHNIVRNPENSPDIFQGLWNTIQSGQMWHGRISNRAKDGGEYIVDSSIIPISDDDNSVTRYMAIRFDITNDMQAYNQVLIEKKDQRMNLGKRAKELLTEQRNNYESQITQLKTELQEKKNEYNIMVMSNQYMGAQEIAELKKFKDKQLKLYDNLDNDEAFLKKVEESAKIQNRKLHNTNDMLRQKNTIINDRSNKIDGFITKLITSSDKLKSVSGSFQENAIKIEDELHKMIDLIKEEAFGGPNELVTYINKEIIPLTDIYSETKEIEQSFNTLNDIKNNYDKSSGNIQSKIDMIEKRHKDTDQEITKEEIAQKDRERRANAQKGNL
ncbi:MAG: PAS domain S-box protein [Patescibacteria group bacterium]|nr:PAS domain S-box protein [Patescibacteria group bacterium]